MKKFCGCRTALDTYIFFDTPRLEEQVVHVMILVPLCTYPFYNSKSVRILCMLFAPFYILCENRVLLSENLSALRTALGWQAGSQEQSRQRRGPGTQDWLWISQHKRTALLFCSFINVVIVWYVRLHAVQDPCLLINLFARCCRPSPMALSCKMQNAINKDSKDAEKSGPATSSH